MSATVTRADYLDAALALLATEGTAGLKVGRLCRSLGVTTGSFYHHFDGLPDLVESLMRHWEQESTARVALAVAEVSDPADAIAVLKRTAVDLPHAAETHIRAWALRDPGVAAVQRRVDAERLAVLEAAIGAVVGPGREARDLATLGLTVLVGFQHARDTGDLAELGRLLDHFESRIEAVAQQHDRAGR